MDTARRPERLLLALALRRRRDRPVRAGRALASFSAALRPILLVVWSLCFGFALGRSGRSWDDMGEVAVFLLTGALVALAERFYHRGHSGRVVGL